MPTEVLDPTTGELIDVGDIDALADSLNRLNAEKREIENAQQAIRSAIGALALEGGKTRRVQGNRSTVRVEIPDTVFTQGVLKEVWNAYPDHAREFLRIERLAVNRREYAKLKGTTAVEPYATIRKMLVSAEKESTAPPWCVVEGSEPRMEMRQETEELF